MRYRVYLDTFFLINFYMDYIILLLVSSVLKYTTTHLLTRRLIGATAGALYACLVLLLKLDGLIWKFFSYFGIVILMSFIINGRTGFRRILKGTVYIYFFSCTLGGILHVLYYYTALGFFMYEGAASTIMILIAATIVIPAIWGTAGKIKTDIGKKDIRMTVLIENNERKVELPAILDTGNSLKDPFFGKPVNIVETESVEKLLLNQDELCYHLVPFSSLGNENGLIPVVRFERIIIKSDRGSLCIEKPFLALYSGKISSGGEYRMILHPEMFQNDLNLGRDKYVFKSDDAEKISDTDDTHV